MQVHKWIWALVLVSVLVFVLSLRQLSDPDLGFHLKYGKWIVTHQSFPATDQTTYTVSDHQYIDLHWLFQVVIYGVFILFGYPGISLFICFLSLLLSLLLLIRLRSLRIPTSIISIAIFAAFLIIDPRIAARPEMFTFLFLTGILLILDLYMEQRKNLLYLLPAIMLVWCNMHALFILGLLVIAVYFIGILIRDHKADKSLLICMIISFLVCFINPYGMKGFSLPIELLTRFDPNNIYNQHIQEFLPFFAQPHFVIRDYLFIILTGVSALVTVRSIKTRKLHELILLLLFGFLAIGSIRNIPLFVLIAIPIVSKQVFELSGKISKWKKKVSSLVFIAMIVLPMAMIPRLLTNAYYLTNNSFNKTGMGINNAHQPVQAANFLLNNHLNGRILNSIGFGGWLSWALPQPVFIDGRLEVMQESIYKEVTQSWNGALPGLINKYQPQLIVYNYLKYYPWTFQMKELKGWRLIYLDGIAAIFAREPFAKQIREVDLSKIPLIDEHSAPKTVNNWLKGFYRQPDYSTMDMLHQTLFCLQINSPQRAKNNMEKAITFFNGANRKTCQGDFKGALTDYDSSIILLPTYTKAYNNRGILRASVFKDYSGAINDFNKAIACDPIFSDAYLGRGTAHFLLQETEAACNDWKHARSLGNLQAVRLIELHCNR